MFRYESTLILVLLALTGCATSTQQTDAAMSKYDRDTEYSVAPREDGFTIFINYTRYQFIPESGAVATACKSAITAIAFEVADKPARVKLLVASFMQPAAV